MQLGAAPSVWLAKAELCLLMSVLLYFMMLPFIKVRKKQNQRTGSLNFKASVNVFVACLILFFPPSSHLLV